MLISILSRFWDFVCTRYTFRNDDIMLISNLTKSVLFEKSKCYIIIYNILFIIVYIYISIYSIDDLRLQIERTFWFFSG